MISKLSEGDPKAAEIVRTMLAWGARVDPDSSLGGLSGPFSLDRLGIYGRAIGRLHDMVCGGDLVRTLSVLRANQLGIIDSRSVHAAIESGLRKRDWLLSEVRGQLPGFGQVRVPASASRFQLERDAHRLGLLLGRGAVDAQGNDAVGAVQRSVVRAILDGDMAVLDVLGGAECDSGSVRVSADRVLEWLPPMPVGRSTEWRPVSEDLRYLSPDGAIDRRYVSGCHRELSREDGGYVRYDADGRVHCDDAPAARGPGGGEFWFRHGERLAGPPPHMALSAIRRV